MADEFIKGLAIFTGAGLAWQVLAGWYRTPGFESTQQLVAPLTLPEGQQTFLDTVAIVMMDAMFWFAILGALTFWVLIPATKRLQYGEPEKE